MTHLEVLRNLANKALEGELSDKELRRLLVASDFTKSNSSRPETVRFLDTAGSGSLATKSATC